MTGTKVFILEHGPGCTPLIPCDTCNVLNQLRHALSPDDYKEFERLLKVAIQEIADLSNHVEKGTPIASLNWLTVQTKRKLQGVGIHTIEALCKLTQNDLLEKGLKNYTIKRIVSSLAMYHGITLA